MKLFRKLGQWTARGWAATKGTMTATFDLRDVFWMTGLAAVTYGVAQIYAPAAWIICGAAVFWMGVRR